MSKFEKGEGKSKERGKGRKRNHSSCFKNVKDTLTATEWIDFFFISPVTQDTNFV